MNGNNGVMFEFDARQVKPATGFEPWESAWYPVVIVRSNLKPTKENSGGYLQLDIQAVSGPREGQVNFIRLNLNNQNEQTVRIAQEQLSAICHVTGVFQVVATGMEDNAVPMLHGKPFMARATLSKNKDTGQEGNNFSTFKDMAGNDPGKAGSGAQPQPNMQQPQPQPNQQWQQPTPQPGAQQPGGWNQPGGATAPNPGPGGAWGQPGAQPNPNPAPPAGGGGWGAPPNPQPQGQQNWTQNPNPNPGNAPWKR